MSIRLILRQCLILGSVVAGLQILTVAQNPPSSSPPTRSPGSDDTSDRTAPAAPLSGIAGIQGEKDAADSDDASNDIPRIPALLGGAGISSAFVSELQRSNYLRGGVNVGGAYDSNALLSVPAQSNTNVSIFPNIMLQQSNSQMRYSLGYAGGLTINENLGNQNEQAQNLIFDSQFRLSPHMNLRVAENFSYTTGMFDAGNGTGTVGSSGGPNNNLITPFSTQLSNVTTVEANYHFALNDLIGASGSFNVANFSNAQAGAQPLMNTQTAAASAFWLHRIFRGDWGGLSYHFQRITFSPSGETRVNSFLAVDTLSLSNQFTLTAFVGPQYIQNQVSSENTQTSNWSFAGGIEGGWANARTSVIAGFSRTISDGGGLLGSRPPASS